MRTAVLYVMFEEYDFLEREVDRLNEQTRRDFTFVCVAGVSARPERLAAVLAKARFPTVALIRHSDNGPAGGFYDGQCWCLEQGFDAIVHVESDCFPTGPDLMEALLTELERHPLVIPVCLPDQLPMGWRFCGIRSDALRKAGLSYKNLYFLTEDVYFVRNVTRTVTPRVLDGVHVYHAPVVDKHRNTDRLLAPFPYLMSRNHMLYNFRLLKRHGARVDLANLVGYLVGHVIYSLHLWVRGKRRSARLMLRGLVDGVLDREDRMNKDRIEELPDDYAVEAVPEFPADLVLDKQDQVTVAQVAQAFGSLGKRVLKRRTSLLLTLITYYLAASIADTDGEKIWRLKDRPREGALALLAFYLAVPLTVLAAPVVVLLGLAVRRGPALEPPAPSRLTPVESTAGIG